LEENYEHNYYHNPAGLGFPLAPGLLRLGWRQRLGGRDNRGLLVTTATPAEEDEDEDDHRGKKEMKENHLHPFLHGKKACSFAVHITPDTQ